MLKLTRFRGHQVQPMTIVDFKAGNLGPMLKSSSTHCGGDRLVLELEEGVRPIFRDRVRLPLAGRALVQTSREAER
jgi:hypothetical protein